MIPQDFISEWKKAAPWSQNDQVEQDLIICRALVEIFSHPILADNLAFRGGTSCMAGSDQDNSRQLVETLK